MLVIVSDLHLNDGTAAPPNVPAEAFVHWWLDVLGLAEQKQVREIEVLYLGDIFDLIRTEHWFYPAPRDPLPPSDEPPIHEAFPEGDRPWGAVPADGGTVQLTQHCRERAIAIVDRIIETSGNQLALMAGDLGALSAPFASDPGNARALAEIRSRTQALRARGVTVTRTYVPGNHDRLAVVLPGVQTRVLGALRASLASPSPHRYHNTNYGVLARHGHECDPFNFAAFDPNRSLDEIPDADYAQVPIGDPITTEIAARLPYAAFHELSRLVGPGLLSPGEVSEIYGHLKQIEDVRPLSATISWILVEGHKLGTQYPPPARDQVLDSLQRVVRDVMARFMGVPFVKAWVKTHDKWGLGFDEADLLQDVARIVRHIDLHTVEKAWPAVEKLEGIWGRSTRSADDYADVAASEPELDASPESGIRYCVYGHTHTYRHEALTCRPDGEERVYFNSGTWRPRVYQARDRTGFLGVKEMTYLVFYSPDEDPLSAAPAFESPAPVGVLGPGRPLPAVGGGFRRKGTSYETWNGLLLKRRRP